MAGTSYSIPFIIALLTIALAFLILYRFIQTILLARHPYKKIENYIQKGQIHRAFEKIRLPLSQKEPLAYYYASLIYKQLNNKKQELYYLQILQKLKLFPPRINPTNVCLRSAFISYNKNDLSNACASFLQALQYSPQNQVALAHIAFMATGQREFEIAEKYLSILCQNFPKIIEYHIAYGVILNMSKNQDGIYAFDQALAIDPQNQTALFLKCLACYKKKKDIEAYNTLKKLNMNVDDIYLKYISHKLGYVLCYLVKKYKEAFKHVTHCFSITRDNHWTQEHLDASVSYIYISILNQKLNHLIEFCDNLINQFSNKNQLYNLKEFCHDLIEGSAKVRKITKRGYDFQMELKIWLSRRFPEDAIYQLSGLATQKKFNMLPFFVASGIVQKPIKKENKKEEITDTQLIYKFNHLEQVAFKNVSQRIISFLDYNVLEEIFSPDLDQYNFIAIHKELRFNKALFCIQQGENQIISDIFIRDLQYNIKSKGVNKVYFIADGKLTEGAKNSLTQINNIFIYTDKKLSKILKIVM